MLSNAIANKTVVQRQMLYAISTKMAKLMEMISTDVMILGGHTHT